MRTKRFRRKRLGSYRTGWPVIAARDDAGAIDFTFDAFFDDRAFRLPGAA